MKAMQIEQIGSADVLILRDVCDQFTIRRTRTLDVLIALGMNK